MIYAIVNPETNAIDNIVEWDGVSEVPWLDKAIALPEPPEVTLPTYEEIASHIESGGDPNDIMPVVEPQAAIGWIYIDGIFTNPVDG